MGCPRRRDRPEIGQSTLEYVGMGAVAAALVVLLMSAAPGVAGSVAGILRGALCSLPGTSCPAPGTGTATRSFQPPACDRSSRVSEDGGSLKVAFVELGADYTFSRSEASDGETRITFVDGARVAAVAGVGGKGKVTVGGRTYGGQLGADGQIGLVVAAGDTWVFRTPADADAFEDWIRREKNEDRRGAFFPPYGPVNGFVEWVRDEEPLPEPTITFIEAGVEAGGSASGFAGVAGASTEASATALVGHSTDSRSGEVTDYYQVDFGAGAEVGTVFAGLGGSWEGSGVVKVSRDAAGEIVRVEIVDTSTGSFEGLLEVDTEKMTLAELTERLAHEAKGTIGASDATVGTIVSTTTLEVASDADRAVVERWARSLDVAAGAAERAIDGGLPDREDDGLSPFGRLLYDQATVSVVEYEGRRSGLALEAEIALGAKLGIDVGTTDATSRAVGAWYLEAPEDGRRVLVPFTACLEAA